MTAASLSEHRVTANLAHLSLPYNYAFITLTLSSSKSLNADTCLTNGRYVHESAANRFVQEGVKDFGKRYTAYMPWRQDEMKEKTHDGKDDVDDARDLVRKKIDVGD